VPPQFSGGLVEVQLSGGAGVLQGGGEVAPESGAVQRVGFAAFGQQPDASAADQQKPVQQAVGDLDRAGVAA
jgi:hypothetical protein